MRSSPASKFLLACAAGVLGAAQSATAALTISTKATSNVTCSSGTCTATAKNAVLNVDQLTGMLASASVTVATGGGALDILIEAPLGWSSASVLSLNAARSVAFDQPTSVAGPGGLSILVNQVRLDGRLSFAAKGQVTFANLGSSLTIGQKSFVLVDSIATLAADIAANPSGDFALAGDYDAKDDGTYTAPPVPGVFGGAFEGLGNTISHVAIKAKSGSPIGFFSDVGSSGSLADIRIASARVAGTTTTDGEPVGALAGLNEGTIDGASSAGAVSAKGVNDQFVGGLVGANTGTIAYSSSSATVNGGNSALVGGLVGLVQSGNVYASSATGAVSGGQGIEAGGLAGSNAGIIEQCFAAANVSSGEESKVGGLAGFDSGTIADSYAEGAATMGGILGYSGGLVGFFQPSGTALIGRSYSTGAVGGGNLDGGLIGDDNSSGTNLAENYWDMTTSGINDPSQGAGTPRNDSGITGLTSHQLRAQLPSGFQRSTWAQDRNINGGFPYLRANPPLK